MKKGEIDIITLGCSKNLVDAERLMARLEAVGYKCVHDSEKPQGEIAIINTCGFIGDAKEESINTILQFVERKRKRKLRLLYVMGCLSERYLADLEAEIPEVDGWFGKFDFFDVVAELLDEATGSLDEVAKPLDEAAEPLDEVAELLDEAPKKALDEVAKSLDEATGALDVVTKSLDEATGSLDEAPRKALDVVTKSLDEATGALDGMQCGAMRVLTTPKHYAYLKISEGCDRMCSYCAIPLITGRHTSRPMEEILEEVRWLVSQGVQELNVIAQDLSSYGKDLYGEHRLAQLVDQIAQVEGVRWIRLHYTYPTDFPFDLLPVMAKHKNVCKYMDIALQHCTDYMLGLMRRHITRAEQDEVIRRIRREVPGICLRTTLLVGHPGETEEDFHELCEWVREMRFDRMGAFAYSHEDGTYCAKHYEDDVPEEVKQHRVEEIMAIQQEISRELMQEKVGQTLEVVIDRVEDGYLIGRTECDSPEVDCEVLAPIPPAAPRLFGTTIQGVPPSQNASLRGREEWIGKMVKVKITRAEEFDLYADIC